MRAGVFALAQADEPGHRVLVAENAVDQGTDGRLEHGNIRGRPRLLTLLEHIAQCGGGGVVGEHRAGHLATGGNGIAVVLFVEELGKHPRAIELHECIEEATPQARPLRMFQAGGRRGQRLGVLLRPASGLHHPILRHRTQGRVHVDVLAEIPQQAEFLVVADLEAPEEKRCLQPRAIELRHVHAALEIGSVDLQAFEEHKQTLAAGIWPAGCQPGHIIEGALSSGRAPVTLLSP